MAEDLAKRAKMMLANGMKPQHEWTPISFSSSGEKEWHCSKCPWDSPFKTFPWTHPIIITEDDL